MADDGTPSMAAVLDAMRQDGAMSDPVGDALRADAETAREEIRAAGINCPSCGVNMADLPDDHRLVLDWEPGQVHCAGHPGADLHDYETAKAAANVGILDDMRERLDLTKPARLVYPVYGRR